jgi:hypothetical protein
MKTITKGVVTIREAETGWDLFWPNETQPEHHTSAAEALSAVRTMGLVLVAGGISSILTVEWFPISHVGHMAIKAIS